MSTYGHCYPRVAFVSEKSCQSDHPPPELPVDSSLLPTGKTQKVLIFGVCGNAKSTVATLHISLTLFQSSLNADGQGLLSLEARNI